MNAVWFFFQTEGFQGQVIVQSWRVQMQDDAGHQIKILMWGKGYACYFTYTLDRFRSKDFIHHLGPHHFNSWYIRMNFSIRNDVYLLLLELGI